MFTSVNRPQRAEYELVGTTDGSSDDGGPSKELEAVVAEISHDPESFPDSFRDEHILVQERRPWIRWIQGAACALVPSFCLPSTKEQKEQPPRPLSSTAWLDGLRGYAAFFVVWHHMSLIWFPWRMHEGYVDHETSYLLQLPFVRLMVSGRPWVFTFFVISGYTLSYRPLQLIQQGGRMDKAYAALSSSLFRRWLRLFIPAVVLNLPVPLLAYYSWYRSKAGQPLKMPHGAVLTINPPLQPSLWLQYVDFASAAVQLVDPFADRGVPGGWTYNTVAWTLPIEFVGSMLVYSVVLGLAQCTPAARLVLTAMLAGVASWLGYWAQFLFLSGVFLASLGLHEELWDWLASLREARLPLLSSPSSSTSARSLSAIPQRRWPGTIASTLLQVVPFLMTLYVLGTPTWSRGGKDAPGYAWLSAFIPTRYIAIGKPDFFLTPLAAVALVSVLSAAPLLQRCFTTRLALYLGRISYSLYLVHATILHGPGIRLGATFLEMTGADTDLGYVLGVGGAAVVVWVACIWCADLGTRLVDAQAIRFGRWIHGKATGH